MKENDTKKKELRSLHGVLVTATDISLIFVAAAAVDCVLAYFLPIIGITTGAILLFAYLLTVFILVPLYYNDLLYSVDVCNINVRRGLFIHRYIRIAIADIQYCIISQGIIQKLYGTYSVYIMLTGSFTIISNISLENAKMIMELAVPQTDTGAGDIIEKGS